MSLKSELSHPWNQGFLFLHSHCKPREEEHSKLFTWCRPECRVLWYKREPGCRFHTSWICPSSCCTDPGGSHGQRSAGYMCYPTHPASPAHCITEKKRKNKQTKLIRNTVIYERNKKKHKQAKLIKNVVIYVALPTLYQEIYNTRNTVFFFLRRRQNL